MHHPDPYFTDKEFITNCSKDWDLTPSAVCPLWELSLAEDSCLFQVYIPFLVWGCVCVLWGVGWGERARNLNVITGQWRHRKALLLLFNLVQLGRVMPASELHVNLAKGLLWLHHRPNFSSSQICFCSLLPLLLIPRAFLNEPPIC